MVISYVLRLRTDALFEGCFVGEVEEVASGRRRRIASMEQLAAFVRSTMADRGGATAVPRAGAGPGAGVAGEPLAGAPGSCEAEPRAEPVAELSW